MLSCILLNMAASLFGLVGMAFWNAWRANEGSFDFRLWVEENTSTIAFSAIAVGLLAVMAVTIPEISEAVKSLTGLDLPDSGNRAAWFTLGCLVYEGRRKMNKKQRN